MLEILVYLNNVNIGDDNSARGVGNELIALYSSYQEIAEYKERN